MADPALVGHLVHELVLPDARNGVGGMTILTGRQLFIGSIDIGTVYAACEFVEYTFMAGSTGRRNILMMDGRALILVIEHEVCAVTVGTDSAGKKSLFNQTLAVNARGVIHHHVSL